MVQVKFIQNWLHDSLKLMLMVSPIDSVTKVLSPSDEKLTNNLPENTIAAEVNILKPRQENAAYLTLPSPPLIISLEYFDTVLSHLSKVVNPGYPLVCVSPCEDQYPDYSLNRKACNFIGLGTGRHNRSYIHYSWEKSILGGKGSERSSFHPIEDTTVFAQSNHKVLDSIFFANENLVRCVATIVDEFGQAGSSVHSDVIRISSDGRGICPTKDKHPTSYTATLDGSDFSAAIAYANKTDDYHPDSVFLDVIVPHQDGMVPIVSTIPIHNVEFLLSEDIYRTHHACSNLHFGSAFLESAPDDIREIKPHQWSTNLRQVRI